MELNRNKNYKKSEWIYIAFRRTGPNPKGPVPSTTLFLELVQFVDFLLNLHDTIMSVCGLDFGNSSLLIGQATKGGVDVILNDSSNRQTA